MKKKNHKQTQHAERENTGKKETAGTMSERLDEWKRKRGRQRERDGRRARKRENINMINSYRRRTKYMKETKKKSENKREEARNVVYSKNRLFP
jgi:hypothetical protein